MDKYFNSIINLKYFNDVCSGVYFAPIMISYFTQLMITLNTAFVDCIILVI